MIFHMPKEFLVAQELRYCAVDGNKIRLGNAKVARKVKFLKRILPNSCPPRGCLRVVPVFGYPIGHGPVHYLVTVVKISQPENNYSILESKYQLNLLTEQHLLDEFKVIEETGSEVIALILMKDFIIIPALATDQ